MGFGLVFALVVVEIGLRVVGVSYGILYVADEHRGWSLRPGITTRGTQEGHAMVKVNSQGLRDREHDLTKPENTIRIAVLGDSFTEAQHVAVEDTFWAVMEDNLGSCPPWSGQDVEVINFGVSSYGTAQELLTLRHFAWDYSPDIVLLAFVRNDFTNNVNLRGKVQPYFNLEDGELVLDNSFREDPGYLFKTSSRGKFLYSAVNRSRVLQIANKNKSLVAKIRAKVLFKDGPPAPVPEAVADDVTLVGGQGADAEPAKVLFKDGPPAPVPEAVADDVTLVGGQGADAEPAVEGVEQEVVLTEELLATINREANERGAKFALFYVTAPPMYRPNLTLQEVAEIPKGKYEKGMEIFGESQGFPVLTLAPDFLKYSNENEVYLHGFPNAGLGSGHWNELGHKLAGDMVSDFLCQTER